MIPKLPHVQKNFAIRWEPLERPRLCWNQFHFRMLRLLFSINKKRPPGRMIFLRGQQIWSPFEISFITFFFLKEKVSLAADKTVLVRNSLKLRPFLMPGIQLVLIGNRSLLHLAFYIPILIDHFSSSRNCACANDKKKKKKVFASIFHLFQNSGHFTWGIQWQIRDYTYISGRKVSRQDVHTSRLSTRKEKIKSLSSEKRLCSIPMLLPTSL